ncbi:aminodeoxychorismate synthase component I [bacterium]|nr:aminodeoxychorismate synthase component I [bacterium]
MITRPLAFDLSLLAAHFAAPAQFPGLLESVAHGTRQARYDVLFALPGERLELRGGVLSGPGASASQADFLPALDAWVASETTQTVTQAAKHLPFVGGWMLFLGYELASQVERRVPHRSFGDNAPDAVALRCRAAVIREHATQQLTLVAEAGTPAADVDALETALRETGAHAPEHGAVPTPTTTHVDSAVNIKAALARIHEYILDGDVFQVNLSREWRADYATVPQATAVYQALRAHNPSPFAGSVRLGDFSVLSSSPERLIQINGREVETRPIAGTRRRDADSTADAALQAELMGHPKERAEHVMLIDLERNDLGRVCLPGSVHVDEMMALETYAHVHHIVSNVCGTLRDDVGPGAAIAAVYPGGTITGCPKVRCMEIIAELEPTARGPYTGAMGYLGVDGRLDLNILIRSVVLQGKRGWARAGAGIVADSDADAEIAEMQAKARGLLPALGIAPEHGLHD